jgi:type 1 glutamine amidotransferase
LVAIAALTQPAFLFAQTKNDDGYRSIFNGENLDGWKADPEIWKVENGILVGKPTTSSQLTWKAGELDDFSLRFHLKVTDGVDAVRLAVRGKAVSLDALADKAGLPGKWLPLELGAHGKQLTLRIGNGGEQQRQLVGGIDHGYGLGDFIGVKGNLEIEFFGSETAQVQIKDIQLKRLPVTVNKKKIVFVAGKKSHGWGSHEHYAGCKLMEKCLLEATNAAEVPVVTTVYKDGWPADPTAFDNADTVVAFCDGGKRHFLHRNGEAFDTIMRNGVGLVCIHYGVEVPKGPSGRRFLDWIGGYFETDWSVNPTWTAKFDHLPNHPITNGVKPFEMYDEWYYHMRFSSQLADVTPVLSTLPGPESLTRGDGPHSNNPYVREAVLEKKEPQHVAWAFTRGDRKGRGFGFTGAHYHKNWANDDFRKLVLNAILWTAHQEVPKTGVLSAAVTEADLDLNQDYPKPTEAEIAKRKNRKAKQQKLEQKKKD